MSKPTSKRELEIRKLEEKLRMAKKELVDTRRKHDTHVKCSVAGALFAKLGVNDIAANLDSKQQVDAFKEFMITQFVDKLERKQDWNEYAARFAESCKQVLADNTTEEK